MRFEFATATRVVFGNGVLAEAGVIAANLGRRALLVTGATPKRAERAQAILGASGVQTVLFSCAGEPKTTDVQNGASLARDSGCDLVIGFGGGSAIDCGKAIAAMITNDGDLLDYLEVIGKGKLIVLPPVPFMALPTTAGAGTEVTRNAVLASPEHRVKVSLRSPLLLAKVALVDPELTLGLPAPLTASTGLDALTQLIEPFTCCRTNPMTDPFCREGMRRASRSLRRAFRDGQDREARTDMSLASLLGGLALANAGLGAVHGFAAPIGGSYPAPHGAVCATLLPHAMRANLAALQARAPESDALARYEEVARTLTGNPAATAEEGAAWVAQLCADLKIPPLRTYGMQPGEFPVIVEKAGAASSMKANSIPLTKGELTAILQAAW